MDFSLTSHQQQIITATREFAEQEITPHLQRLEEDVDFRMNLYRQMGQKGLFVLSLGHDALAYALALKEVAKADAGISVAMTVTNMVAEAIQRYGTELQKDRYLRRITSGECVPAAFALTEKHAGSDAKSIQMTASLDGDSYVLNGEKHLISNADLAGVILVLAQTANNSISAFLVDHDTPGWSVLCKEQKLGLLTAHLVRIQFDNCHIPISQLLGNEGDGLKIALSALDNGRLGIAAQSLGIGEAAFESSRKYAKEREQFGHRLIDFEGVSFKLADMQVKLSAGEALLYKACWMRDKQMDIRSIAAQVKLFNSEAANDIATNALQIYGGYGYIKANNVEKYFRDARATTIYEGTSEIQRLLISRLLG